jgi:signal transduction histidine kinase/ligand-binding sensor domain-containing protein
MRIWCGIFILYVVCSHGSVNARTYQFYAEHLSTRDGLSSSAVNAIIQDQKGFLWFGTEHGLNRYDGFRFKVYKHNPSDSTSLSHNFIWSLTEDDDGIIWIATDGGGINRFDPVTETFIHYYHDPDDSTSPGSNSIQYIFVDSYNDVWIGTWGDGLNKYNRNTDTFTRFSHNPDNPKSLSNDKIFWICEDSRGNLWIGTDGGGASVLDRSASTFTHFKHSAGDPEGIGDNTILSIYEDSRGYIWFGTYGEVISKYDHRTNTFTNYSAGSSTFTGKIGWTIIEDSAGLIWVGTLTTGIYLYDYENDSFSHVVNNPFNPHSLNSNYIRSMFEDKSGIVWIGTVMSGLNKIDRKPQKFHHIAHELNNKNSLPDNAVSAILEDSHGYLWFGTLSEGLSKYDPLEHRFTHYRSDPRNPKSLNGELIKKLYEDRNGTLWIGTYYSVLNTYDRATDTFTHLNLEELTDYPPGINNIRAIYEDNDGIFWLGVHGGGVVRHDRDRMTYVRFAESDTSATTLSSDYIITIAEDDHENLWIGTHGGGLNKFDKHETTFVSYTFNSNNPNSLSDNIITDLYFDTHGTLWVGTYTGGLNRFNKNDNTFTRFREIDGLPSDLVCGIIEDDNGFLWLNTGNGISKFDPVHFTFKNYDYSDGIRHGECSPEASVKTRNGWIYFGGIEGVTYFHPDNVYDNTYEPPVVITSIKINNLEYSRMNPVYADSVLLSPKDNSLSVEFASLDYTLPSKNEYAVFLDGFDQEWNYIGNRRFTNYTNLAPGKYILNVKGSNNNGIWNEHPARLHVIIAPPFWATWWFRTLFITLIVGFLYYNRVSTLRKERLTQQEISKHLIKSQEQERKRIAAELHDSLGQNLLIIKNRALIGLDRPDIDTLINQMNDISELTSHTINEVREISYNLRPYQLDRLGLKEAIDSIIDRITRTSSIACSVSIEALDRKFPKDTEINLYRIVQELLNNIVKHSQADRITVNAVDSDGELKLTVADNGKGFDLEHIKSDPHNGQGFGLTGMTERVKIMNGTIDIHSSPGAGTKVTITILLPSDL